MRKVKYAVALVLAFAISMNGEAHCETTEPSKRIIEITEEVGEMYYVCPELLQAIIFYESSYNNSCRTGSCVGYMQVSEKYHKDRAKSLGVSLYSEYGNILTGTDYLMELFSRYGDLELALMKYNGDSRAEALSKAGKKSEYVEKVLTLSEQLERAHGK